MKPGKPNPRHETRLSTLLVVLVVNLVPLHEVLVARWTISEVIALFWLESVAIGLFHWVKLLTCNPDRRPRSKRDKELISDFPLFYGTFTLCQGMALVAAYFVIAFDGGTLAQAEGFARHSGLDGFLWALAALLAGHAYAFFREFILGGGRQRETIHTLGMGPFGRVVLMQFVLIGGGIIAGLSGQPLWALVVLVLIKIIAELLAGWFSRTTIGASDLADAHTASDSPSKG